MRYENDTLLDFQSIAEDLSYYITSFSLLLDTYHNT
jgi:hypothetical protein